MTAWNERMGRIRYNVQSGATNASKSLLVFAVRLITGVVLGLVFAIAFDEIFGFGTVAFTFVTMMGIMTFLYVSRKWGLIPVLIFDLFCVLIGLLIRFYVVVAPGA